MSELETEFQKAAADVQKLAQRPSNDDLLRLYAHFKQATTGDITGSRPGMLNLAGRAKFDAWAGLKGMAKPAAMQEYVKIVREIQKN